MAMKCFPPQYVHGCPTEGIEHLSGDNQRALDFTSLPIQQDDPDQIYR